MGQTARDNGKYLWLPYLNFISLIIFVMGLTWWAVWAWGLPNIFAIQQNDYYTPYLLSAVAQSLAAILALVFTISLIVAQISARYSHHVFDIFFDVYTICYFAFFVAAVLLPLWLLKNQIPSVIGIKCTLVLSTVCLMLLIPYFIRFTVKLTPEYLLSYLESNALIQLRAKPSIQPENVNKIQGIVMSALVLKDYETCRQGIRTIAFLAYEASKLESPDSESLSITHVKLYEKLEYIFKVTYEDPMLPLYTVEEIFWNGMRAVEDNLLNEANNIINRLFNLSYAAVDKRLDEVATEAVSSINVLNRHLVRKRLKSLETDRFYTLRRIGIASAEQGLKDTLDQCISGLRQIGFQLIESRKGGSLVKKIVAELSELYKGVSSVLPKSAYTICEELIIMGTISHILGNLDVRDDIISMLKTTIGTKFVKQQYLEMQKSPWRISLYTYKHKNFKNALSQFIEMVE